MNSNWFEEKKASIGGVEIPIECIMWEQRDLKFSAPHYHDYVEILYGISGISEIWANGKTMILSPGEMAVINSKHAHTVRTAYGEKSSYIVIKYMPQVLYASHQSIFEFKYAIPFMIDNSVYTEFFSSGTLNNTEIPEIMKKIYDEWESKEYGYEIALRIYVLKISLWIVRYWNNELKDQIIGIEATGNLMHAISKAMEYTRSNYNSATALQAANHAGLSYSYFSGTFKKVMNQTFNEYLNCVRISEAKRMLVCTDDDITKIAMDTGFATSSYFIEKFRKHEGLTPKKFRTLYKTAELGFDN